MYTIHKYILLLLAVFIILYHKKEILLKMSDISCGLQCYLLIQNELFIDKFFINPAIFSLDLKKNTPLKNK